MNLGLVRGGARGAEVAMALAAVGSVAVMLVPLPTWLLDGLLVANLALSVSLLMVALSIPAVTSLGALPGLLLLATLFRLGLNVSTTRLILLDADAGQVVGAFGGFVARGSLVVGAVIFLIVTLIQFVVVARGAERVAEVAARFSLDAMPGRQLAIDADLRAGAIGLAEARARREALQRESQLHGALDGAMKFIKGDAVAGLLITGINITAGLAIGVLERGMGLAEAARLYTVLTLGDGLACQLPALLLATAAGVAVTRVTGRGESLGVEVADELLAHPRALGMGAGLLVALAVVPGMPSMALLLCGVGLGAVAWRARGRSMRPERSVEGGLEPLSVVLGSLPEEAGAAWEARWSARAEALWRRTGVRIPQAALRLDPSQGSRVEVWIDELPAWRGGLEGDGSLEALAVQVEAVVLGRLPDFLGPQEVQEALDALRAVAPADVEAVVPRLLSLTALTGVLRALLAEGVSVRHLRPILGALASQAPQGDDPGALVEAARAGLRRVITFTLSPDGEALEVLLVDREVEELLRASLRHEDGRARLRLPPDLRRRLQAVAVDGLEQGAAPILTTPTLRPHLRALQAEVRPDVVVLSHAELEPALRLSPRGTLAL